MKLTKYDREAFVRAVLDDTPQEDFDAKARAIVHAAAASRLPPKVKAVYDDSETRGFLQVSRYLAMPGSLNNVYTYDAFEWTDELRKKLDELAAKKSVQRATIRALSSKLTAVIGACSTLNQAKERLPEFVKYLPAERDGTGATNLPAVANLVTDLVAAGWPKEKAA